METSTTNPMGTDGFEFVEYASPKPAELAKQFEQMGFKKVAEHRSKAVSLYRQGEINFILNAEPESQAMEFAKQHGPSACAMAFRVKDAQAAYQRAIDLGAEPFLAPISQGELAIPAITGIGGSVIYLVDRYGEQTIYDDDFKYIVDDRCPAGVGLTYIDHLTHNVNRGEMDKWAGFYERLFNFREIRYFDIEGKLTGLTSRAMTSPCGKIRIPINQSSDDKSQIEEFLHEFDGEGIQHIALGTDDIYQTIAAMKANGLVFLDTPDTYYEKIEERVPWHHEDVGELKTQRILIDGAPTDDGGLLLQIFTENMLGPVFFEIIQRKGNEGFGEGNFKALFESIELDQIRRGVLDGDEA